MKTYLQSIAKYEQTIQEALIQEAPHTVFKNVPPEFEYLLNGITDLGFENLGLNEVQFRDIMFGYSGEGVAIPGTQLKMRANGTFNGIIEPISPGEKLPTLPDNWQEAVLVVGYDNKVIHAGSLVRKEQLPPE